MRTRDPTHDKILQAILTLPAGEILRRVAISDFREKDFVPSEVLSSLVRARFGSKSLMLGAIAGALHGRVIAEAKYFFLTNKRGRQLLRRGSDAIQDGVGYFWKKFIEDKQDVCNAEKRFKVYLEDRLKDFVRTHLDTEEGSRLSIDELSAKDEDEKSVPYAETIGNDDDSPENEVSRQEYANLQLNTLFFGLPVKEKKAFLLRIVYEYEWKRVAAILKCSIPTARTLVMNARTRIEEKGND